MIEDFRVLRTDKVGSENDLPVGWTADTSSPLVVVDQKQGKRLLSLLSSSLDFSRYFEKKGISKLWERCGLHDYREFFHPCNSLGESVHLATGFISEIEGFSLDAGQIPSRLRKRFEYIPIEQPLSDGAEVFKIDNENWLIKDGARKYKVEKSQDPGLALLFLHEVGSGWIRCPVETECFVALSNYTDFDYDPKRNYREVASKAYISKDALTRLQIARQGLCQVTDANVWGFIKPSFSGGNKAAFTQEIVPFNFHDGKYFEIPRLIDSSSRIRKTYGSEEKPVGIIKNGFRSIDRFFEEGINPVFTEALPRGAEVVLQALDYYVEKGIINKEEYEEEKECIIAGLWRRNMEQAYCITEKAPDGSRLVVFMGMNSLGEKLGSEEKAWVQNELSDRLVKYSPRLQVFVLTNDPKLMRIHDAKRLIFAKP